MKGLIIVFVIIVLLGGVGGGLTAFGVVPDVLGVKPLLAGLMGGAPPAEDAPAPPPEPEPEVDLGPEPKFMRVPQMAVPVIMEGGAPRHILLSLRLHVDPDKTSDIRRDMPRLQDAYVTALLKTLPDILVRSGRLDLASIKVVLNTVTGQAIGPGKVHDVLVESAFER